MILDGGTSVAVTRKIVTLQFWVQPPGVSPMCLYLNWIEGLATNQDAGSSSLSRHAIFNAPVAQLAEQQTLNLWVGGSIPPRSTIVNGL